MRKGQWLGLATLLGAMAVVLGLTGSALSQKQPADAPKPPADAPKQPANAPKPGADAPKLPPDGAPMPVEPKKPGNEDVLTLPQRIAKAAKVTEENAGRMLEALGPAIRDELRRGKSVSIPGLGTFRVVRVAEHKDLKNGRPVTIPASNTIEFLGEGDVVQAVNTDTARPEETVPAFQYNPLPNANPGQKMPLIRNPGTRVP
jgi:nucleoid DNA-binding protein